MWIELVNVSHYIFFCSIAVPPTKQRHLRRKSNTKWESSSDEEQEEEDRRKEKKNKYESDSDEYEK